MPSLPLPPGGSDLAGGDLPVVSLADVLAVLPQQLRPDDSAAVRDAIFASLTQILINYQKRASQGAGLSDVLRASGAYLAEIGAEQGIYIQAGESDTAYRARILTAPDIVTPEAILSGVDSILASFTTIKAQYSESLQDRWFMSDGEAVWHSYLYDSADIPRPPDYYNRLYEDNQAANGGMARVQSSPGSARVFDDSIGRLLVLRIPDLSAVGSAIPGMFDTSDQDAFFVGDGTSSSNTSFLFDNSASAQTVYDAIVNLVNRIKGHSIRWQLIVDPYLVS